MFNIQKKRTIFLILLSINSVNTGRNIILCIVDVTFEKKVARTNFDELEVSWKKK